MAITIDELKAAITPAEVEKMTRIEGLINVRTSLEEDRQEAAENLAEIFENREEEIHNLGLDYGGIKAAIKILDDAYLALMAAAKAAQFSSIKEV